MSNYQLSSSDKNCCNAKPLLVIPKKGVLIHSRMTAILRQLLSLKTDNCLSNEFHALFSSYLDLFDEYQESVLEHNNRVASCKSGCGCCCNHWVEDVNSFEASIICDYIQNHLPEQIPEIIKKCKSDQKQLVHIEKCIIDHPDISDMPDDQLDHTDLLLSVFYQFKRPCPLIDKKGMCTIYPMRPLTCRIYMSFSAPSCCDPEYINEDDTPTYLLDVEEEASELLDQLHFKFLKFEGNTGLRSLLLSHLGNAELLTH
ncbi:MAG TPA: YkgJ family cysteine cluster protein [Chitinispirillaceae bacterium]|nr:YkgJ family cysteine cluster protein [Chitinispirillaceae bacterium]